MKKQIIALLSSMVLSEVSQAGLPCNNKVAGDWKFGTTGAACNVVPLQTQKFVKSQYAPVLLNEERLQEDARTQYLSNLYPVVRETATYYIKRRKPKASPAEVDGFVAGVFALVSQESTWSHYRLGKDGIARSMRGDKLHGYGLMQVDDRHHPVAIKKGKGTDLIYNILYGLDVFYDNWQKAASAKCVSSNTDYLSRARAAWSAYNAGPRALCRWKNLKSRFAQRDADYLFKHTKRPWNSLVRDSKAPSILDVKCLAEGKRPCAGK